MGRITVFCANDLNSKQVRKALEKRNLPYEEINVVLHPKRLTDIEALTGQSSVPQVFFNTRYIGGAQETLKELRRWDRSNRYKTPLKKYKAEVAAAYDPADAKLALAQAPAPTPPQQVTQRKTPVSVELPDGTKTTVLDIADKLKNTLPRNEISVKGVIFKNAFTGASAVRTFSEGMKITKEEATSFGTRLLNSKIIHCVSNSDNKKSSPKSTAELKTSNDEVYVLQCYRTLDVLNSFCVWAQEPVNPNVHAIITNLGRRWHMAMAAGADEDGFVDCEKVLNDRNYAIFEEAVCELQGVRVSKLDEREYKAFAINVYNLMLQYAFIKVGAPLSDTDRAHFLQNVRFNIGGHLFSFQEWTNGVLRANNKGGLSSKIPFGRLDKRRKFALSKLDNRIHFATNLGAPVGSSHSLPFSVFTAENLDHELDIAAKVWCADDYNFLVDRKKHKVKLSSIIEIYAADFTSKGSDLLDEFYSISTGKKKSDLGAMTSRQNNGPKVLPQEPQWGKYTRSTIWYHKEHIESDIRGVKGVLKRFTPSRAPKNENSRLETLRNLNILDTLPEERFDRITRMCLDTFDVTIVFVSLVDQNRQWFKSTQFCQMAPNPGTQTPRDISFCGHAILGASDEVFQVLNAQEDDRFADNPLVTGPLGVRFYAGCPIAVPSDDGNGLVNIGTLCMVDQKPHQKGMSEDELAQFRYYTEMVKVEMLKQKDSCKDGMDTVSTSSSHSLSSMGSIASIDMMSSMGSFASIDIDF